MILPQHHHVLTHRRVKKVQPFQLTCGYAPLPTCIRARSVESNAKTPMENLYKVFSSHLDFSNSDEECNKKDAKQCESIPNQNKITLSPSIMSLISQPKSFVDDINIEEIMNYKSIYKKGSSHFQKKSTGDETTKLLQPKPNIPITQSKSIHSVTQNTWSGKKALKSTKIDSKTKLQIDFETLCSSQPVGKACNNFAEPLQSSEAKTKYDSHFAVKKSHTVSSSIKNSSFNPVVIPENSPKLLGFNNRPLSRSDNIRLLYDNIDSQEDSCNTTQQEAKVSTTETSEVEKTQKKKINFLLSKPLRKLRKSKVDKIEIYEPKLALYFATGCKTDI